MKYKAILFDLDGTLLPVDIDLFTKTYFAELCKKLVPFGYSPEEMTKSIWAGTKAMVKNDGSRKNIEVFWDFFENLLGRDTTEIKKICDTFYTNEFNLARRVCADNPLAIEAVKAARAAADKVVLATNPLFPMDGQVTRLSWLGLTPDMFELVTAYETDCFCKPNPKYFEDVCRRIGIAPEDCLMIGNDEDEDMLCAASLGMDTYLVTDYLIPSRDGTPYTGKRGTFAEMVEFLKA